MHRHVPSRIGRVAWAGAATYVDYRLHVPKRPDDLSFDKRLADAPVTQNTEIDMYRAALKEFNLRAAQRLLHVCLVNGGLFIKIGQQLASFNHALPVEYTLTLSALQDKAHSLSEAVCRSTDNNGT